MYINITRNRKWKRDVIYNFLSKWMESDEVFVLARQPKKIHRIWWKPMKSDSIFGVVTRIAASVMSSRTNTHHRRVEAHSERCEESGEGRWNAHRRSSRKMSAAFAFDRFDVSQPQPACERFAVRVHDKIMLAFEKYFSLSFSGR